MADALVTIGADLSALRREIATIVPEGGKAAAKVLDDMAKAVKRAEDAAKKASKQMTALQRSTGGTAGAAASLGRAKENAAQLASALNVVSPELGAAATQASALGGALRVAASGGPIAVAALGALATVLGTGYVAWKAYNEESARAEHIAEEVAAAEDARIPILAALRQATIDLKVATGEMTEEAAKLDSIASAALGRYAQATEAARKHVAELREDQAGILTQLVDIGESVLPSWTVYGAALRGLTTNTTEYQQEIDALNGEIDKAITLTEKQATAAKDATTAQERKRQATKAATDAEKEARDIAEGQARAVEQLRAIQAAAALEVLDGEERITEEYRRQYEQIIALAAASGDLVMAEQAAAAVRLAAEEKITEEREKRHEAQLAAADAERKQAERDAEEAVEREIRKNAQILDSSAMLASNLESVFGTLLDKQLESGGKGAIALYTLQMAASQAKIIAYAAEGYAQAAALLPPANVIQAGAVTAGIAAAEAMLLTAKPPSFSDTPGVLRAGSRGMTAGFAPGDLVVAGRSESDLVRQMARAGIGMGGTEVLVRDADQHRGRYGRNPLAPPDTYTPLRRRAGRIPGRS